MQSLKILLLYPEAPQTFWSLKHALRFFNRKAWSPPLGLLTVAAMLPKDFECRLQDLNVKPVREEEIAWADYVFISAMEVQRDSSRELINRCKRLGVKVVAGGPLFTNDPAAFRDVDHLVLNEAEVTLPQFLSDLACGNPKPLYGTDKFADLSASPLPAYRLVDIRDYGVLSIQYSRGCPNQCEFCDITALFGRKPRTKSAAQIVDELDNIYSTGWRGKIYFADDNIMCNPSYLKRDLLPAIIAWRRGKESISFNTQITMNLADDQELMDLMYGAGFESVFIGIETPDEKSLKECKKRQNLHRNMGDQIRQLQRSGFHVEGGFIIGFDNDGLDIFRRQYELIQNNGVVMAMVGLLQAPVGTDLHRRMAREGRLLGDHCPNNVIDSTNIRTRIDRETLITNYRALIQSLYEPRNYYNRVRNFLSEYREPKVKPLITREDFFAAMRCFFWLGLVRTGRFDFWRIFLWTFLHKRDSVQNFMGLAIVGYHFRKVRDELLARPPAHVSAAAALSAHPLFTESANEGPNAAPMRLALREE